MQGCLKRLSDLKLFPHHPLWSLCFPFYHGLECRNQKNSPNSCTSPTARHFAASYSIRCCVLPFPQLKGHIFTVVKFLFSLKRTFVLLSQGADTDQRSGRSVCRSSWGWGGGGRVLTLVWTGWVCVLAVGSTSSIKPQLQAALSTRHFFCMWSVMQVVKQFHFQIQKRERSNLRPSMLTLTKHTSGTCPHVMSHPGICSTLWDHHCFCFIPKRQTNHQFYQNCSRL